ncbi:MAG: hypothetical protein LBR53_04925 [Deltaproteobacteria bacterium]|jgi:hypothetical protein|nr:hypothetical protein [Deltaproteobacteria bacterium]
MTKPKKIGHTEQPIDSAVKRPGNTPQKKPAKKTGGYWADYHPNYGPPLILGLAVIIFYHFIPKRVGTYPFVISVILVIAASLPIYLSLTYFKAVKDAIIFQNLNREGIVYKLFGRRLFFNVWSAVWSVILACGLILNLASLKLTEWFFVYLTLPVQLIIFAKCYRATRKEVNVWHLSPYYSSLAASWFTPLLMTFIFILSMSFVSGAPPQLSPWEAVSIQADLFPAARSHSLRFLNDWFSVITGGQDFVIGKISPHGFWSWFLLNIIFNCTLFIPLSFLLRVVTIPARDLIRLTGRTSMKPEKGSFFQFFTSALLPPILVGFLFFTQSLKMELLFSGETGRELARQRNNLDVYLVMIDGECYDSAIMKDVADETWKLAQDANRFKSKLKTELKDEARKIFNAYRANVDGYLDWYYSLPAEYGRLATLILGEVEEYMAQTLNERLKRNVDASGVDRILSSYQNSLSSLPESVNLEGLKQRYRRNCSADVKPILELKTDNHISDKSVPVFIPFNTRLGASVAVGFSAGLVAGVGVKILVERIAAKFAFKLAAKTLLKIAVARAASYGGATAAGSATGAAIGSVVPGLGTGAGAAVGALVGIGSAFLMDKFILELEEAVSREELKTNILNSINIQEKELNKLIDSL